MTKTPTKQATTTRTKKLSLMKSVKNSPKPITARRLSLRLTDLSLQVPTVNLDNGIAERSPFRSTSEPTSELKEPLRKMSRNSIKPQFYSPNGQMVHHDALIHRNKFFVEPKKKVIKKGFGSSSNRLLGPAFLHHGSVVGETTYHEKQASSKTTLIRKLQTPKRKGAKKTNVAIKTSKRALAVVSLGIKARRSIKMANRRK